MNIFKADGTRVTLASIATTAAADPLAVLSNDLYEKKRFNDTDADPQGANKELFAKAGAEVRQSTINSWFPKCTVSSHTPGTGVAAGGTTVTFKGGDLAGVTAVTFGGTAATAVTAVVAADGTVELTCVSPAHAAATVDIVLTADGGTTTLTGGFIYT